jgi:hypothetical protein
VHQHKPISSAAFTTVHANRDDLAIAHEGFILVISDSMESGTTSHRIQWLLLVFHPCPWILGMTSKSPISTSIFVSHDGITVFLTFVAHPWRIENKPNQARRNYLCCSTPLCLTLTLQLPLLSSTHPRGPTHMPTLHSPGQHVLQCAVECSTRAVNSCRTVGVFQKVCFTLPSYEFSFQLQHAL